MSSGGLELPPGDTGHEGETGDIPPGAVSVARPVEIGAELDWGADAWSEVRTRAQRAGRAYIWLNLVEQRLRAVVAAVLRPIYEPVHGDDWVVAAAGPAGQEWVQRAVAVREVSRRKGYLLDPADDNVLSFLTLPQLRELMVQHWPCFEPYVDDRRDVELALDELEVARNVVSRNRALNEAVLAQAERASARLLDVLGGGAGAPAAHRLPIDAVEDLVGDRYADVVSVHSDRVRLQRQLPAEDLFSHAHAARRDRHRPQSAGPELLGAPPGAARRVGLPGPAALPQPGEQRGQAARARTGAEEGRAEPFGRDEHPAHAAGAGPAA